MRTHVHNYVKWLLYHSLAGPRTSMQKSCDNREDMSATFSKSSTALLGLYRLAYSNHHNSSTINIISKPVLPIPTKCTMATTQSRDICQQCRLVHFVSSVSRTKINARLYLPTLNITGWFILIRYRWADNTHYSSAHLKVVSSSFRASICPGGLLQWPTSYREMPNASLTQRVLKHAKP